MCSLAHRVQNNSWVVQRNKNKLLVPEKESRSEKYQPSFQALQGPILTASPVKTSIKKKTKNDVVFSFQVPLTFSKLHWHLNILLLDKSQMIPRRKNFLISCVFSLLPRQVEVWENRERYNKCQKQLSIKVDKGQSGLLHNEQIDH